MPIATTQIVNNLEEPPIHEITPEINLLTAMLARAIMDLGANAHKKDRRDAVAWFLGIEPRKGDITFLVVTEELQLSTKALSYIKNAMEEVKRIEEITREIENAEENQCLPKGQAKGARISKLVKNAWDNERPTDSAVLRGTKRGPFRHRCPKRVAEFSYRMQSNCLKKVAS